MVVDSIEGDVDIIIVVVILLCCEMVYDVIASKVMVML